MNSQRDKDIDIAVIMTCHNRQEKTIQCLDSLFRSEYRFSIYITDDGCTDGTRDLISKKYPQVHIIDGDGNLFWNRGMYMAWVEALKNHHKYYLWVNDDIIITKGFMEELLECESMGNGNCIVSGIIADKATGETIYGGYKQDKTLITPSGRPEKITFMNGNLVLVPDNVVSKIGILDPEFHHDLGDVDYGLTAKENGINAYTTRKVVAYGYANDYCRVRKWGTNIIGRFKTLNSPLGSPISKNYYFRVKHFGIVHAIAYCTNIVLINILSDYVIGALGLSKYIK